MVTPLLRVRDLSIWDTSGGKSSTTTLVEGVDLEIAAGEIVALIGESGAGKSLTAKAILDLVPVGLQSKAGCLVFGGTDYGVLRARKALRGRRIGWVLQEPSSSLDPLYSVGQQLSEVLRVHHVVPKGETKQRIRELLQWVALGDPSRVLRQFPHQLSGGEAQRVMLALALAAEPDLLVADEPTTGLDSLHRREILWLLKKLSMERNLSVLLLTHDLLAVSEICSRALVLNAGRVVESSSARDLLESPSHPFSRKMVTSQQTYREEPLERNIVTERLRGEGPEVIAGEASCSFLSHCPERIEECAVSRPGLVAIGPSRWCACFCREAL